MSQPMYTATFVHPNGTRTIVWRNSRHVTHKSVRGAIKALEQYAARTLVQGDAFAVGQVKDTRTGEHKTTICL